MKINHIYRSDTPLQERSLTDFLDNTVDSYGIPFSYRKGSYLFSVGEEAEGIYLVKKGLIKIAETTSDGQDITHYLRFPGEVIGIAEAVLQRKFGRYAKCLTDTEVVFVKASILLSEMSHNANIAMGLLFLSGFVIMESFSSLATIKSKPVSVRLAWLLNEMQEKSRPAEGESGNRLILRINHEEIAHIVGCSRQTVTEILRKWKELGYLTYTRNNLTVIDTDDLSTMAEASLAP